MSEFITPHQAVINSHRGEFFFFKLDCDLWHKLCPSLHFILNFALFFFFRFSEYSLSSFFCEFSMCIFLLITVNTIFSLSYQIVRHIEPLEKWAKLSTDIIITIIVIITKPGMIKQVLPVTLETGAVSLVYQNLATSSRGHKGMKFCHGFRKVTEDSPFWKRLFKHNIS